ncbi:hypothetical protein ACFOMH_20435, partial [Paracoccus mangrovi]
MDKNIVETHLDQSGETAGAMRMSRRKFAQFAVLLAGTSALALKSAPALAEEKQLVFVNWGGDAVKAYDGAFPKLLLTSLARRPTENVKLLLTARTYRMSE